MLKNRIMDEKNHHKQVRINMKNYQSGKSRYDYYFYDFKSKRPGIDALYHICFIIGHEELYYDAEN